MTLANKAIQNDNFVDAVTTLSLAFGGAVAVGDLLVAGAPILGANAAANVATIADTNNNVWRQAPGQYLQTTGTNIRQAIIWWAVSNGTGTPTVTITNTLSCDTGLFIQGYSSTTGRPFLDPNCTVYADDGGVLSSPPKANAIRPRYRNSLLVLLAAPENPTCSVGAGWTDSDDNTHLGGYFTIQTNVAYIVPTVVSAGANSWAIKVAVFNDGPQIASGTILPRTKAYGFPSFPLARRPKIKLGIAPPAPTGVAVTIAQNLSGLRSSATVAESQNVTIAQNIGGLRSSATVSDSNATTIAQRVGGLRSSVTVAETDAATIAQRVGSLRSAATVAEGNAAAVAQRLGGLRSSATVGEADSVAIAQRLGGLRSSATVAEGSAATVAQRLGELRSGAMVGETDASTIAQKLGGLRSSATMGGANTAAVAARLGGLRSAATASEAVPTTIAQRVGGLRSSVIVGDASAINAIVAQRVGSLRSASAVSESVGATIAIRVGGLRSSATVSDGAATSGPLRLSPSSAHLLRCTPSSAPLLDLTITTGPPMLSVFPGQSVRFSLLAQVLGLDTTPGGTTTLTLLPPNGATDAPIVDTAPSVDSAGNLHSDQVIPVNATPGIWAEDWLAQGSSPSQCGRSRRLFEVKALLV